MKEMNVKRGENSIEGLIEWPAGLRQLFSEPCRPCIALFALLFRRIVA